MALWQGDTFGLYLFVIVLDFGMPQAMKGRKSNFGFELEKRRSRRHPIVSICDLEFADDIASLSKDIHKTWELLKGVHHESVKM